ncbi:MAG TPA: hypothetical protein VMT85_18455 [Thermoanaerobaculia bacterium]|nr:hypothetical protein [Thermoanaerobaculia bacterium]
MTSDQQPGPEVWVVGLLLAALIGAVSFWAVDLPHLDEWVLAGDLATADLSSLLERAWTPHNEHRLLIPRLLLVGLARSTAWDVRAEVFLGLSFAIVIAALVWRVGGRIEGRAQRAVFRSLAAAFALGLHQVENLVWGWQVAVFLCVASAVAAIVMLAEGEELTRRRLALAALLGLVSSFSYGAGLMVWPAGAVVLATRVDRSSAPQSFGLGIRLGPWLAIGAAALTAYYLGMPAPSDLGAGPPARLVVHALAFLASPVVRAWPAPALGVAVGVAGLALVALGLARTGARGRRELLDPVWLGFIVFALGSSAMVALGRAEYGLHQAMVSRYTTLANLLWIGVLGLLTGSMGRSRVGLALALALGAAVLAGGAASIDDFVGQHQTRSVARGFLQRGVIVEELAPKIAGALSHLEVAAPIACANRLSVFRRYRGEDLDCRFELWPEAIEGQRSLPEQRFEWQPPTALSAGWLRTETGFTIGVGNGEIEGRWTLTRESEQRRCVRGAATDAATGDPVVELIVAEGTIARRLSFRRQARRLETSGGPVVQFVGISACWRPVARAAGSPVVVLATTDRGTTGILPPR